MAALEESLLEVHVLPGESRLVRAASILRTVLGSCVGITFFVPRFGLGAICHPMLPLCPTPTRAGTPESSRRRYVDFAIRDMARQLDALGASRGETQVKLFGGCDVLPVSDGDLRPTVGRLNAEAALRVLVDEGFVVRASRLGGKAGIHIRFRTDSGEVLLRQLPGSDAGDRPPTNERCEPEPSPEERRR